MARPVKQRLVCELPGIAEFAPCTAKELETVEMTIDEYEVIRLIDHLKLTQNECALQMNVARTTVQSIYDNARSKIADTIVNGKRLIIQGGNYTLCSDSNACCGKNCAKRRCSNGQCNIEHSDCSCCSQNAKH